MSIRKQIRMAMLTILAISIAFAAFSFAKTRVLADDALRVGYELLPEVDGAMELRLITLQAYVLAERIIAGSSDADLEDVTALFNEARGFGIAMLEGGMTSEGEFVPTQSAEVRERIEQALIELEQVAEMTQARIIASTDSSGVGSDADVVFDAEYDAIVEDLLNLSRDSRFATDINAQIAIGDARYRLAHGHLITAEILGGDFGEDFGEVTESFETAAADLEILSAAAPEDTAALQTRIADLSALALQRYETTLARVAQSEASDRDYAQAYARFANSADQAETLVQAHISEELQRVERDSLLAQGAALLSALALLMTLAFVNRTLSRRVVNRVEDITTVVTRVAAGDTDCEIPAWPNTDELGRLNEAVGQFREALIEQLRLEGQARDAVAAAQKARNESEATARRFASVNAKLGDVASDIGGQSDEFIAIGKAIAGQQDQQRQLLSGIEQSVADISKAVGENTATAKTAREVLTQVTALVEQGSQAMEGLVAQVNAISDSGGQVGGLVTQIEDISFQTNILALNAAVEAARAGEAGKGFAIVAHEVRDLSGRTAQAAQSIRDQLSETQTLISSGIDATGHADKKLRDITEAVNGLRDGLEAVTASSENQINAVQTVSHAVDRFGENFAEAKAMADSCLESGGGLSEQAREIARIISSGERRKRDDPRFNGQDRRNRTPAHDRADDAETPQPDAA